ncbi:hypothetical protein KR767_06665 [Luteibacter anthropi]|uniref:hypothetical protein n=1 Tax=Luteibacter anthropi TaxID=564369 RepID=UPI0020324892|nr:hypothetical protein [Luteibacter anthropi]URX63731.1 hypothetical protein KR767_06665 [Luteibacter anthropi]
MPNAHLGGGFAVFTSLVPPFIDDVSLVSRVFREPRTNVLVECFARPVDINSIVGWLLMAGDGYIRTCADEIINKALIPAGEGRNLWFELDRVSGRLVRGTEHAAGRRMEKAWTEPWPDHLVIVRFSGGAGTVRMTTEDCGAGGLGDLASSPVFDGEEWALGR